jgi:hypothetical protein
VQSWKMTLVLLLASSAARAEEWVVLRKPPETGESPAGILVDSASIEILASGIRRATVKVDFLSRRVRSEEFGPTVLSFTIWVVSYDGEKQTLHDDSVDLHRIDGSVQGFDYSREAKWRHVPENRAVDVTFDFVCGWKPKQGLVLRKWMPISSRCPRGVSFRRFDESGLRLRSEGL